MKKILSTIIFSFFCILNITSAEEIQDYTQWATVISVYDGDTLTVLRDGEIENDKVRIIGIDTPELRKGKKSTCLGKEAADYAKNYLNGHRVLLIRDTKTPNRDSFGRLLRSVRVEGRVDIGKKLLLKGYAKVYQNSKFKWKRRYSRYEKISIKRKKGIFGEKCSFESINKTQNILQNTPAPTYTPKNRNIKSSQYNLSDGPVKKSHRSSTCHTKASRSFKNTKYYDWYDTMEDCLNSGGKPFHN